MQVMYVRVFSRLNVTGKLQGNEYGERNRQYTDNSGFNCEGRA